MGHDPQLVAGQGKQCDFTLDVLQSRRMSGLLEILYSQAANGASPNRYPLAWFLTIKMALLLVISKCGCREKETVREVVVLDKWLRSDRARN